MANSQRYKQLESRTKAIEISFLPAIKLSGNYTKQEQDHTRAYFLLIHAEIESYLEEISGKVAQSAFDKWKKNGTKSNVLLSLASFIQFNENKINKNIIEERLSKTLSNFNARLKSNHGIKETNILEMLLPIGFKYDEIDKTWLNTINSFGKDRGEIAHTAAKVQQPLDPVTLKATVQQILSEIKIIDEKLRKIK